MAVTIAFSTPESVAQRVDALARREGRSRSNQITYLLTMALDALEADRQPCVAPQGLELGPGKETDRGR